MRALSLKGVDPEVDTITHNVAVTACKQKGAGWHCMTNAEWSAVALLCKARGFMPREITITARTMPLQVRRAYHPTHTAAPPSGES